MDRSLHFTAQQCVPDLCEVLIDEHKAHTPPAMRQQFLQSWEVYRCPIAVHVLGFFLVSTITFLPRDMLIY